MSMQVIFSKILDMSLTSSIVIILICIIMLFLRKSPKIFSYVLWIIVLFRLLCPYSIESQVSVIPQSTYALSEQQDNQNIDIVKDNNNLVYIEENKVHNSANILRILWIIGMLSIATYNLVIYFKLKKRLTISLRLKDNIFIADDINSPFVIGLIKPKIYLPCNLNEKEQQYIILHEKQHIKRFDHIVKAMAFLALCIHWFNPLVWVSFVLLGKDIEMSCDEAVIKNLSEDIRIDYCESLLALSTGKQIVSGTPLAFGEGSTKDRVKNIVNWKKPAFWVIVISVIICIIVLVSFSTNKPNVKQIDETIDFVQYEPKTEFKVPNAIVEFAKDYVNQKIEQYREGWPEITSPDYIPEITAAKIIGLTQVETKADRVNSGEQLWLLEYRLKVNGNIQSIIAGGMSEENGWITEWSSSGQPYLLVHWQENNNKTRWELVDIVSYEDFITYNTVEMIEKYGDKYTATAREKYIAKQ